MHTQHKRPCPEPVDYISEPTVRKFVYSDPLNRQAEEKRIDPIFRLMISGVCTLVSESDTLNRDFDCWLLHNGRLYFVH